MVWPFGRRRERESQDANDVLRRYNEAEAQRVAGMMAGARPDAPAESASLTVPTGASVFEVEDVFTITGRGRVATGRLASGVLRVDDAVVVERDGTVVGAGRIAGIEMFRRRADEVRPGEMAGLLLRDTDAARGDVIRPAPSV